MADGCDVEGATILDSIVGIRTKVQEGARIANAVILGADFYEDSPAPGLPKLGIGRDVVLNRVVIDKNARIGDGAQLTN